MITALTFLLTTAIFLTSVSQPPPPPPQSSCVEELVSLSPCLGYISAPPNNINQDVTPQCCHAFSSTDGDCLCYLLRQPLIFGFPLNESRVLSLSSVCDSSTRNGSFARSGSLDSFCSASPALPPLRSTPGSGNSKPPNSGPTNASSHSISLAPGPVWSSPASLNLTPDSTVRSARPPTPSVEEPAKGQSASNLFYSSSCWFLTGALLLIFFHL